MYVFMMILISVVNLTRSITLINWTRQTPVLYRFSIDCVCTCLYVIDCDWVMFVSDHPTTHGLGELRSWITFSSLNDGIVLSKTSMELEQKKIKIKRSETTELGSETHSNQFKVTFRLEIHVRVKSSTLSQRVLHAPFQT